MPINYSKIRKEKGLTTLRVVMISSNFIKEEEDSEEDLEEDSEEEELIFKIY